MILTAESVLFTCCPPAPPARKVSIRKSSLLISISISSSIRGEQKTEAKPAPAQQKPQPANQSTNASGQFSALITKAGQAISVKNKAAAVQTYNQMAAVYKTLPQQQKPLAYKHMLNVNKQMSLLK